MGGPKADTASVFVGQPGSATPWIVEDFSPARYNSTTDLIADVAGLYTDTEDVNPSMISLDKTDGYGSQQSMKYTFPDRSASGSVCNDFTVGRNIGFPSNVDEVWVEVWAKFSANFETRVPACDGQSAPDYKFMFGRVLNNGRFEIKAGTFGNSLATNYPGGTTKNKAYPTSNYFDGQWHRWRMHIKVSSAQTGIARFYLDNTAIGQVSGINIPGGAIYGLALGRNLNQGPLQVQSVNWGQVKVWRVDPGWGW
jgi:hypothetical protein